MVSLSVDIHDSLIPLHAGAIFFHGCTVEHRVPLYMVVIGCIGIFTTILGCCCLCVDATAEEKKNAFSCINKTVKFALHLAGLLPTGYILAAFTTWRDNGKPSCYLNATNIDCCDPPVMYGTVSFLMIASGLPFLVLIIFMCCWLASYCCCCDDDLCCCRIRRKERYECLS